LFAGSSIWYLTGLFPKNFIGAGFVGHLGVFYATTIGLWLLSRPRYLAYRAAGRQLAAPSTRGIPWGLALHNLKVAAVPVVLHGCVVAMKNPQVPFCHIATSFSFPFPAVMLFVGLLWGIFGGSPVVKFLDLHAEADVGILNAI